MTSGVRPALPQVSMSAAGIESKAVARNRTPLADFAETLGMDKQPGKQKAADDKAGSPDAGPRPSWPRFASQFDQPVGRTRDISPESDATSIETDQEDENASDARQEFRAEPSDAKDHTLPNITPGTTDTLPPTPAALPAASAKERENHKLEDAPSQGQRPGNEHGAISNEPSPAVATDRGKEKAFVPMARTGQAEPVQIDPSVRTVDRIDQRSRDAAKEALPEGPREPAKPAPRITVLAQQNIPAPMPSTVFALVQSIAASDLVASTGTPLSPDAVHASATHASAQSLKIQLHPAELGMVTATMRFAGEQLTIELQVESHEAYRRLTNDSETIVSALRDLGYDVERVTVLQPSIASSPAARADASVSMPSPQGRSAEQFGSGMANGGGGSGGRPAGDDGHQGRGDQHRSSPRSENPGTGLYI